MELGTFIEGLERLSRLGDKVVCISPLIDVLKKNRKTAESKSPTVCCGLV